MENIKQDPLEKVAMNMAEGLIDELEKEGKTKRKGKEIIQSHLLFKGLQLYTGMILSLAGAILANGRAEWFVILLTGLLFFIETFEIHLMPEKKKFPAQMVLSGSILLIGILQILETIGKNFSLNVFYLLLIFLGGLLMFMEVAKTGNITQVKN